MPLDLAKIYAATPLPKRLNPLQMMQLSEDARKSGRERLQQQILGFHADDPRATSAALAKHGFGEQSRAMAAMADTAEDRALAEQQRVWGTVHRVLSTVTVAEQQAREAGRDVEMAGRNAWETAVKGLADTWRGEGESPIAAFKYEDKEDIMMKSLALSTGDAPSGHIWLPTGELVDMTAKKEVELSLAQERKNEEIRKARVYMRKHAEKEGEGWQENLVFTGAYTDAGVPEKMFALASQRMTGEDPDYHIYWKELAPDIFGGEDVQLPPSEDDDDNGRPFGEQVFDFIVPLVSKFVPSPLAGVPRHLPPLVDEGDSTEVQTEKLAAALQSEDRREQAIDEIISNIWFDETMRDKPIFESMLKAWGITPEEYQASIKRQKLLRPEGYDLEAPGVAVAPIIHASSSGG